MNVTKKQLEEASEKHKVRLEELRSMIQWGDWTKVGDKLGMSPNHCLQVFNRLTSKRHKEVVIALESVLAEKIENLNQYHN